MTDRNKIFHVVLAGGGTGGHLVPGLALARELQRRTPCTVSFFTTGRDVERSLLDPTRHVCKTLPATPPGAGVWSKAKATVTGALSVAKSLLAFRRNRPDCVVSLGGYGAFAPGVAAIAANVPLVCLEPNAIAGRATRLLSGLAQAVFTQWLLPDSMLATGTRQLALGNPVPHDIADGDADLANADYGLDPRKKTLLVMGGSQGARALNDSVLKNLDVFDQYSKYVQVLLLTGASEYESVRNSFPLAPPWLHIAPFTHDMPDVLAAADLVLCRAGATTIAELSAAGKAMVLVPYPHAKDRHQHANARRMVDRGAALWYEEHALTAPTMEFLIEEALLNDWNRLDIANKAAAMSKPFAADEVAREMVRMMSTRARTQPGDSTMRWLASTRFDRVQVEKAMGNLAQARITGKKKSRKAA